MENVTIREISGEEIELCRPLCNELMAFQKAQSHFMSEIFDNMNFDTRMKPSYEKAERKQVLLVEHEGKPVGYLFNTVETVTDEAAKMMPPWSGKVEKKLGKKIQGFYSENLPLPAKVGTISNLYFAPTLRGMGLGKTLMDRAMAWFAEMGDVETILVHVSNGNTAAQKFYEKMGFVFDHETLGGFITTMVYPK